MPRARVVLVHGIRTSSSMWRNQLLPLARYDVDARAIDLPAHGARIGEPFSLASAFDAIDDALGSEGPDDDAPRLLVGLSLGGYLSLAYAADRGDRVDGLVAASCGTRPRGPALGGYQRLAGAIRMLPDRGRALNDAMANLFLSPAAAADVVAGGVALDVMADAIGAIATVDEEAAIARIDRPIWFVNGRFDHFRLEERRMLRAARDARLVVVPGASHLVSLARPEAFTAIVLGAVAELERRRSVEMRAA